MPQRLRLLLTAAFPLAILLGIPSPASPSAAAGDRGLSAIGAPVLSSPADGATLTSFGPTLAWSNPSGITQYHIQIIPANNDGPGADLHIGSPGTSFRVPPPPQWYGLLPGMSYTWRVRVSDATAFAGLDDPSWGPWAQRRFRTPAVSASTISSVGPANGAVLTDLGATLQWKDSRSDLFYYEVQVSKDPGFNTDPATAVAPVYWELRHAGVTVPPSSYLVPGTLENFTTYYWRVRPRVQGDGVPVAWSPAFRFSTGIFPAGGLDSRIVLAQYYAWYDTDSFGPSLTADTPVKPYNSDDQATIDRHVAENRRAGVDALSLSWQGPGDRTDSNLQKLLASGQARGLWVTVTVETDKPQFADQERLVAGLIHARDRYTTRPNWLRYQGRPVFLFWRPGSVAVAPGQTPLAAWQSIRDRVDPGRQALWVMEGLDWSLLEVFDGQFGYSVAWSSDPYYTASSWAKRVRDKANQLGQARVFMATAMPGYDDTRVRPAPEGFAKDREGGAYFARTWDAAIAAAADWVNVTSYNEWIEGSQMEPSVTYGDAYLQINAEWSARFKGG